MAKQFLGAVGLAIVAAVTASVSTANAVTFTPSCTSDFECIPLPSAQVNAESLYIDVDGERVATAGNTGSLDYTIYVPSFDAGNGNQVQGSVGNTTFPIPGVGANLNFATAPDASGPDAIGAAGVNVTYFFEVLAAPKAPGPQTTIFMNASGLAEVTPGAGSASTTLDVSGSGVTISLTESFNVVVQPIVVSIDKLYTVNMEAGVTLNNHEPDNAVTALATVDPIFTVADPTNYGIVFSEGIGNGGGAPEPSTWAMLLIGFAGLGYAGHRARKTSRV